jgi:hypothetical protein
MEIQKHGISVKELMDRIPSIFQPREYDAGASLAKHKSGKQLGALAHILKIF